MKILFDTNIVLDLIDNSRTTAKETVIMAENLDTNFAYCVSMDSITTIIHILRKKGEEATNLTKTIASEFRCLDLKVEEIFFANDIIDSAIICDYEDAQMIAAGVRHECVTLITNDKELLNSVNDMIEIVSPEEIIISLGWSKNLLGIWEPSDPMQNRYKAILEQSDEE